MGAALALITVGGIMVYSALKGLSLTDVVAGLTGDTLDAKGGGLFSGANALGDSPGPIGDATVDTSGESPKAIIDTEVIPLGVLHGMRTAQGLPLTPANVVAANAAHGSTVTGGRSDHQGPPTVAWAVDMSNGTSPTPQMDALAKDLASKFGIPWDGSGLVSHTRAGIRYQLIYRTLEGGNHFNHVHFGAKRAA